MGHLLWYTANRLIYALRCNNINNKCINVYIIITLCSNNATINTTNHDATTNNTNNDNDHDNDGISIIINDNNIDNINNDNINNTPAQGIG